MYLKSIGIVTNSNSKVASFLSENLKYVLDRFVKINNYYINELREESLIKDDVVLFMIKEKTLECEKYVENRENIIVIERTIRSGEVYKIFTLPQNTKVLVVNDNKETTFETTALLYQIGVTNLQLIPYEEGKFYDDIDIAITPDEEKHVPEYINTIINIGNRCIDTSTFIKIMNKLGLENKTLSERLIKYSENIINLNEGIKNSYRELFVKKEELDMAINLSKEGVMLIDNKDNIVIINSAFREIFNLNKFKEYKTIHDLLDKELIKELKKDTMENEVLEINNKFINVNKRKVKSLGQDTGFYFNIQEITYIKQLEQNLSRKLRNKGLIAKYNFKYLKTASPRMIDCINLGKKIASSELTVLITGESGTGKEVMAQSIHNGSSRANQPFVAVNCAALPESLLESELFGYEKGSFTGALKEGKTGLFEQAHNGTIFLDEIGDMPISLQARILRVLQEKQIMRVGSQRVIDINVRVISATNRNLLDMVEKGEFRADLFYRLNVLPINIPSLRDRKEDILVIMDGFKDKKLELSNEVRELLLNYKWPGNVRELQNVVSYIELMSDGYVTMEHIPFYIINSQRNFEREYTVISNRCNIHTALKMLEILQEKDSMNLGGVGRRNIEDALSCTGHTTTEAEIRRILTILNELQLTASNVGRKGSQITQKGKNFINWEKNRMNS